MDMPSVSPMWIVMLLMGLLLLSFILPHTLVGQFQELVDGAGSPCTPPAGSWVCGSFSRRCVARSETEENQSFYSIRSKLDLS